MTASACSHKPSEADLSYMPSANALRTDSAASAGEKPSLPELAEGPALPNRHFRIDTSHSLAAVKSFELEPAGSKLAGEPAGAKLAGAKLAGATPEASPPAHSYRDDPSHQQSWLRLHSIELIDKLQNWSADLDAREAQLNARTALLEHRERQLRLERQNSQLELDELKRALQQEVAEMRAVARRLAFE